MRIAVAIDGPAGAGKSTIAKILADKFNLMYINTGSMYRAVTLFSLKKDIKPDDVQKILNLIDTMDMHFKDERLFVNSKDISDEITMPFVSKNVSFYASIPEVREKLVLIMQDMSKKFNVIMDGRDICSVVLKDAPFKFYLTASAEKRAERRYKELRDRGIEVSYDEILKDIQKRDYIDSNRKTNPLKKAEDALYIDSTKMDVNQVVTKMSDVISNNIKH